MPMYVYMLASGRHGTLYIGVTNDIHRRVGEHKNKVRPGFTSRYGVDRLVWYEVYERPIEAIAQEKRLKNWRRDWKAALIERENPEWADLTPSLTM